jgi:hypothetical protein
MNDWMHSIVAQERYRDMQRETQAADRARQVRAHQRRVSIWSRAARWFGRGKDVQPARAAPARSVYGK